MVTVRCYSAGWLVMLGSLLLAFVSGHQNSAFTPWGITGLLWLVAGYRILAKSEEWPPFVRYWGWIMNAGGIDKNGSLARWIFGVGTIVLGLLALGLGVGGVLSLLGNDAFLEG
jgi:hypothetical protein